MFSAKENADSLGRKHTHRTRGGAGVTIREGSLFLMLQIPKMPPIMRMVHFPHYLDHRKRGKI